MIRFQLVVRVFGEDEVKLIKDILAELGYHSNVVPDDAAYISVRNGNDVGYAPRGTSTEGAQCYRDGTIRTIEELLRGVDE